MPREIAAEDWADEDVTGVLSDSVMAILSRLREAEADVTALEADNEAQDTTIAGIQTNLTALEATVATLNTTVALIQTRLALVNGLLHLW